MVMDTNLWRTSAAETFSSGPLDCALDADLVIVGGGFTGCSAALQARELGAEVCVIEAETVGHGGSGRNAGLVNAGLWLPPDEVEHALGKPEGERLNRALAAGPDLVFDLIEKHAIKCEPIRNGTLHCAHGPTGWSDLNNRYEQQVARGAPVTLLSAEEARERTGSAAIFGALHDARAGTIQPLAYCRGLARAAAAAGAKIFEKSPVVAIRRDGEGWIVSTAKGSVRAKAMLCATNAYHQDFDGMERPQTVGVNYFQLATKPLKGNLLNMVLPGREGCWDTAPVMSSFRMDQAGRFIVGAVGALDKIGEGVHAGWARRKMSKLFPLLAEMPLEHAWYGRIAMTDDHIPKILSLGPDGYAVFGYSGRGISPGTTFGRAIANALLRNDNEGLPVSPVDRYDVRYAKMRERYYELGATLTHLVSR